MDIYPAIRTVESYYGKVTFWKFIKGIYVLPNLVILQGRDERMIFGAELSYLSLTAHS